MKRAARSAALVAAVLPNLPFGIPRSATFSHVQPNLKFGWIECKH